MRPSFFGSFPERGLMVHSSENFEQAAEKPISVYLGVDPTARSLHAGNLLALMGLLHFQNHGHQVIALVRLVHP